MPFHDRIEAGRRLAHALVPYYRRPEPLILALPRGGVPVAAEIATALRAPLDLIIVRKIGLPRQPELAMGAVVDGAEPIVVRNEDIIRLGRVTAADFARACHHECAEIERRRRAYLAGRAHVPVAGRVVIVVDDGIATGATMRAALRATRLRGPERLVLAVPVAPPEVVDDLRGEVDDLVCLERPAVFEAIGAFYGAFPQLDDGEVVAILDRLAVPGQARNTPPGCQPEPRET
jgi:predicted phosphoribosyltransferase